MTKEAKIILTLAGLFTIAFGLSDLFITLFIWKQTNDYGTLALYHLSHTLATPPVFMLAGWLTKKRNGVWPLRLGIGFFILFFILILYFRDQVVDAILVFGLLFGVASGFYWLAIQVLAFDCTDTRNRDTYNGINGFITSIGGAISPLLASFIVDKLPDDTGYFTVFFLSLVFFTAQILVSFKLKFKYTNEKLYWSKIFDYTDKNWKRLMGANFTWGMRNGVIIFVMQILIFSTTSSELSLGTITFLASIVSSLAFLVQQKIIKPKHRVRSILFGTFFMFVAVLGVVFKVTLPTLVTYSFINALALPFFFVPLASATFNIISLNNEKDFRIEYIINREWVLDSGRALSILILILLIAFTDIDMTLSLFLLCIGSVQLVSYLFLRKITTWEKS